ncbi:MAG TPA: hypothetical protein DEG28_08685 [Porphyromonadaceae bacterium]|nr:hypothetical protein [Porphyromonadaceae bacterium]HBX45941.1 hypothetical protein [Porphyromonadaceae bacterium]
MKYGLFLLLLLVPVAISAQKDVRKSVRKGNKAYQQQKFSDAATSYQEAIEKNAASKEANYNLANTLYKQKKWDESIAQMNHYLSIEQENPVNRSAAFHNIGNATLQKKDLQKSMEAYKMALRLNPEDNEARYNLAVVQKMIQDQQQNQDQQQDKDKQDQQQNQDQQQQPQPQDQQDKQKRPEEQNEPEQMSRDNARQMLQAIEQDEKETQEKVQRMKAEERKQQAEDNRRQNKNW